MFQTFRENGQFNKAYSIYGSELADVPKWNEIVKTSKIPNQSVLVWASRARILRKCIKNKCKTKYNFHVIIS